MNGIEDINGEFIFDVNLSKKIVEVVFPSLIHTLLISGRLERDRINDKEYISSLIKELLNEEDSLPKVQIERYGKYKESIESELICGRTDTAIILTSVCIEHILNHFYQYILMLKFNLSEDESTSAVSRLNIRDKSTWFFKMVSKQEMNNDILTNILFINKIRNELVHYKADAQDLDEEKLGANNKVTNYISSLNPLILKETINKLEELLADIEKNSDEDIKLAYEITDKFMS